MPSLFEAYEVAIQDSDPVRAALEARLLAREAPESIAAKSCMRTAAVQWYQVAFFHVDDRLDATDYIVGQVVRLHDRAACDAERKHRVWRLVGYFLGPLVLDQLLLDQADLPRPTAPGEVSATLRKDIVGTAARRAMIALRTMSPTDRNDRPALLRTFLRLQFLEQQTQQRYRMHAALCPPIRLEDNLAAFLKAADRARLPWPLSLSPELAGSETLGLTPDVEERLSRSMPAGSNVPSPCTGS